MSQKLAFIRICFKYALVVLPIFAYIALFSQHSKVQSILGQKCEKNVIVDLDRIVFGQSVYELMNNIQHWSLDILCAFMYLLHYPLPFLYLIHLFYKTDKKYTIKFLLSFGCVNCLCVIIQYVVPTPPPWMFSNTHLGPEAKFRNFDALFQINLFKNIYSKSPLVCGAWPSLHTAWPSIIFSLRPWFNKTVALLHVLLIGFSAIYSGHHYLIDVLFGFIVAFVLTNYSIRFVEEYFVLEKDFSLIHKEMLNIFSFLNPYFDVTHKKNEILIYKILKTDLHFEKDNIQLV
jgi:hypothetical protein